MNTLQFLTAVAFRMLTAVTRFLTGIGTNYTVHLLILGLMMLWLFAHQVITLHLWQQLGFYCAALCLLLLAAGVLSAII